VLVFVYVVAFVAWCRLVVAIKHSCDACRTGERSSGAVSAAAQASSSSSLAATPASGLEQRREMSLRYARDINKQRASYSDRWGFLTGSWTLWLAAASKCRSSMRHVALCVCV
jgi:hypothetical protein